MGAWTGVEVSGGERRTDSRALEREVTEHDDSVDLRVQGGDSDSVSGLNNWEYKDAI